jgi:hypothetical protein
MKGGTRRGSKTKRKTPSKVGTSSTVPRSKRRRTQHHSTLRIPRSVDATDIFGQGWLRNPMCVGSFIATLGESVDESSWLNASTTSSQTPVPASATCQTNEQNGSGPLSQRATEAVVEDCQQPHPPGPVEKSAGDPGNDRQGTPANAGNGVEKKV